MDAASSTLDPRSPIPDLVRRVDALETAAESYVTLEDVCRACAVDDLDRARDAARRSTDAVDSAAGGADVIQAALDDDLLLVDERLRLDPTSGELRPVMLCRLNRRHPLVRQLLAW